jgi:hypothetical protein
LRKQGLEAVNHRSRKNVHQRGSGSASAHRYLSHGNSAPSYKEAQLYGNAGL